MKGRTLEGFKEQLNLPENPQYKGMAITATYEIKFSIKRLVVPA